MVLWSVVPARESVISAISAQMESTVRSVPLATLFRHVPHARLDTQAVPVPSATLVSSWKQTALATLAR